MYNLLTRNDCTFPKKNRLLKSIDFQWRNIRTRRYETELCTFLVRKSFLGYSKLGLVISRKNVRRSVARNLIKRIARESFRHHKDLIKNYDTLMIVRKGADTLDRKTLRNILDKQWLKLLEFKLS